MPDSLFPTSAEYYHQRVEWIRQAAGTRFDDLELQCLTFVVQIVPDRRDAVAIIRQTSRAERDLLDRRHLHRLKVPHERQPLRRAAVGCR